jgi:hypothetical protein
MNATERMLAALHVGYELRQMAGAALRIDSTSDEVTHFALLEWDCRGMAAGTAAVFHA